MGMSRDYPSPTILKYYSQHEKKHRTSVANRKLQTQYKTTETTHFLEHSHEHVSDELIYRNTPPNFIFGYSAAEQM